MTWTTFANLTTPTLPELDGNFSLLSFVTNITCTAVGTNTITLTGQNNAAVITAYALGMRFQAIASATNTGAVTAQYQTLALLPVYKDGPSGPVLLTGTEIVQLTAFTLIYDPALNAGGGGFHLQNSITALSGFSIGSLNVGLLGAASLNASTFALAQIAFGSLTATVGSITNLIGSIASVGTLQLKTGAPLLRLNSTLTSAVFTSLTPGQAQFATLTWTGVQAFDNFDIGWSVVPTSSVVFSAYASVTNSVVIQAFNPLASATITLNTVNFRLTNFGWT